MRVVIDEERCTGHGRCYATAPEVFAADDDGYGLVELDDVAGDLVERVGSVRRTAPNERSRSSWSEAIDRARDTE